MFIETAFQNPLYYVAVVLTVMISICLHELAHGIAAIMLGDRTPIEQERITLNPMIHMGGVSLAALFLVGISWGSMPIDPTRIRGRFGEALVALAGPVSNILLALISLTALGFWLRHAHTAGRLQGTSFNAAYVLFIFGLTNVKLALFNLIPCPPLDGAHIAANLLPGVASTLRSTTGGAVGVFLVLFLFAGKIISPAALWLGEHYLDWVRGY